MIYIYRFTIKETHECYVGQHRTTTCDDPYKDTYKGSGVNWVQLLKLYDLWEIDKFRKGVKKEILKVWKNDVSREEVGLAEKKAIEQTRELYQGLFSDFCLNVYDGSLPSWQYDTQEEAELARTEWYETHKEKLKQWHKQYYENHKEQRKQYDKQYYENHKEEHKEWCKQYRENHKEELKQYRENHKEEHKEWCKQYYKNHKEEEKEYRENHKEEIKEYYETHKEEIKEKNKQYNQLPQVKLAKKVKTWKLKHNYPSPDVAIFPETWTDKEITEYKRQWEKHNEL